MSPKTWFFSFKKAAGPRRYLVAAIFFSVTALFDRIASWLKGGSMMDLIGMPSWAAGIIVLLLFFLYWTIERLVLLDRRMSGARAELAKLRSEGVEIRNDGVEIKDEGAWRQWEKAANEWSEKVYVNLRKISEADAEWFRVLDVVPVTPRVPHIPFNKEHTKLFGEHDCRVDRLGSMVYNLWRE